MKTIKIKVIFHTGINQYKIGDSDNLSEDNFDELSNFCIPLESFQGLVKKYNLK